MATDDKTCTICPYFRIKPGKEEEFKAIVEQMVERTATEEKALYYGFTFTDDGIAFCREGYVDGEAALAHVQNVGDLLDQLLELSDLTRFELHGPAEELDKMREPMAPLNPEYYMLEYGFCR